MATSRIGSVFVRPSQIDWMDIYIRIQVVIELVIEPITVLSVDVTLQSEPTVTQVSNCYFSITDDEWLKTIEQW